MTYTFFTNSDSEEEDTKYSSFVELEEFEEDDEEPRGFVRVQTGSDLGPTPEGPGIWESSREAPTPWDPAESFFAYI